MCSIARGVKHASLDLAIEIPLETSAFVDSLEWPITEVDRALRGSAVDDVPSKIRLGPLPYRRVIEAS